MFFVAYAVSKYGITEYTDPFPTARRAKAYFEKYRCPIMSRGLPVQIAEFKKEPKNLYAALKKRVERQQKRRE